ncbi:transcriptional regulator [Bradyrhizobium sp. ARR65]|uniref:transcriptional regulator n=1 Tax=Bradyrhizobium sp. ARR65 TaxID=1040989 RepID=UPI000A03ADC2|nr:transcriptional regulator [Bradyrhizobium sp. ARR65]
MSGKKPVEPSPESLLRAKRQRLAQEEGARAMADLEKQAIEVRQNMQRLRALREAREADEVKKSDALPQAVKKKRKRRIVRYG